MNSVNVFKNLDDKIGVKCLYLSAGTNLIYEKSSTSLAKSLFTNFFNASLWPVYIFVYLLEEIRDLWSIWEHVYHAWVKRYNWKPNFCTYYHLIN